MDLMPDMTCFSHRLPDGSDVDAILNSSGVTISVDRKTVIRFTIEDLRTALRVHDEDAAAERRAS